MVVVVAVVVVVIVVVVVSSLSFCIVIGFAVCIVCKRGLKTWTVIIYTTSVSVYTTHTHFYIIIILCVCLCIVYGSYIIHIFGPFVYCLRCNIVYLLCVCVLDRDHGLRRAPFSCLCRIYFNTQGGLCFTLRQWWRWRPTICTQYPYPQ